LTGDGIDHNSLPLKRELFASIELSYEYDLPAIIVGKFIPENTRWTALAGGALTGWCC
jgi:hypothetical protein